MNEKIDPKFDQPAFDKKMTSGLEKALIEAEKAVAQVGVYAIISEIEGLMANIDKRIKRVRTILEEFDDSLAQGHGRLFGGDDHTNKGPRS